jgi:hypothetical protein
MIFISLLFIDTKSSGHFSSSLYTSDSTSGSSTSSFSEFSSFTLAKDEELLDYLEGLKEFEPLIFFNFVMSSLIFFLSAS